jgi:TetR/AcrR family transcriptional regulator, regulator of cefoperazone and chloramphenicol sensitivity
VTSAPVQAVDTRQRLLEAAQRLFTERGFAKVTVRDITREAQANLAAVSYHFGDKLGLYEAVLELGLRFALELNEDTMLPREGHSAEECLRYYVQHYLPRIIHADRKGWIYQLLNHESADPTPVARRYVQQAILPRIEYLLGVVRDLLGEGAQPDRINRCVTSIQSQCLFYFPDPFKSMVRPGWQPQSEEEIRETAEHIAEFSLAGIRAMAQLRRGPRLRPR